jgi:hypothetical protein
MMWGGGGVGGSWAWSAGLACVYNMAVAVAVANVMMACGVGAVHRATAAMTARHGVCEHMR